MDHTLHFTKRDAALAWLFSCLLLAGILASCGGSPNRASTPAPTAVRRNIEPSDRASSCLNQCIEVAMGSIIPNTAVARSRFQK